MASEDRDARLLSLRAGVEIRATERGFASTTVTHMMARGIPTLTNLDAHSVFAAPSLSRTGLSVIDQGEDLDRRLVEFLQPILVAWHGEAEHGGGGQGLPGRGEPAGLLLGAEQEICRG